MKHQLIRNIVLGIVAVVVIIVGGMDFLLSTYYKGVFPAFTWVNGVYCTGKTVSEVNEELLRDVKAPVLTITDRNGSQAKIDLADAGYVVSYETALIGQVNKYEFMTIADKMTSERHLELIPERYWDVEMLYGLVLELPMIQEELNRDKIFAIECQDGEYILKDELSMHLLDFLCLHYIEKCVEEEIYDINLVDGSCYMDYSPQDVKAEDVVLQWEKLNTFLDCGIVFDMGAEQIAVDRKIASGFVSVDEDGEILFDENGNIIPDEEAMTAFIEGIADAYDTVGTELAFEATRGETVMVPYKKYGTKLDRDAEIAYFIDAFKRGVSEVHVPKYKQEGYVRGLNDIGTTYIEIDMTNQKMYAYVDGVCQVETDIVTGNMRRGWDTPEGVNYIYAKQKNRILRGADYASFVSYWMPVNGGIGIHDATWRGEFGGEIYKKNGSHGCINTPKADMKTIYELYEVGTPVVMFY